MIEVIVTMCLIGTPLDVHPTDLLTHATTKDQCQAATKTFLEDPAKITPHSCMQNAAKHALEWLKTHPGYQVRAIGCRPKKDVGEAI